FEARCNMGRGYRARAATIRAHGRNPVPAHDPFTPPDQPLSLPAPGDQHAPCQPPSGPCRPPLPHPRPREPRHDRRRASPPPPARADSGGTLLLVSASGEASRAPDIATASAGVTTQAANANTAMRENATQMTRVMEAIRAAGVAEKDIQTSGINIHPSYRHAENEAPVISGYNASNTVSLKVRDVAKLGEV